MSCFIMCKVLVLNGMRRLPRNVRAARFLVPRMECVLYTVQSAVISVQCAQSAICSQQCRPLSV